MRAGKVGSRGAARCGRSGVVPIAYDGEAVGSGVLAAKGADDRQRVVRGEARRLLRQEVGFSLESLLLLSRTGLGLFAEHLAFPASLAGAGKLLLLGIGGDIVARRSRRM